MGFMESSDIDLVRRAQEEDESAFEQLVDKYKKKVYYIAYQMTGNHTDADDVAQETFLRAYRGIRDFKGDSNFYTWLYRILINCCMDCLRKRRKRAGDLELNEAIDLSERAQAAVLPMSGESALLSAERNELKNAIREALSALSPKHRMAVVLHDMDGMPHDAIAQIMGCSVGTVRSRLHYARLKMQQKLRKFL